MNYKACCCVVILFIEPTHCREARKSKVVAEGGYRRAVLSVTFLLLLFVPKSFCQCPF
jgi:hypothetical protein